VSYKQLLLQQIFHKVPSYAFLPVFSQKPSRGLVFKAVAVLPFSKIIEKWNTLTAVFWSPHYLGLNSTQPRNRSANDFL